MASMSLLFAAVLLTCMTTAHVAQAQLGILGGIVGTVNITGTVPCSTGVTSTTVADFPNALVQLQCGGSVVASTSTDINGGFKMTLNLLTSLVSTLLQDCTVVVNTPLSNCNASLPVGGILKSTLQLVNNVGGILNGLLGQVTALTVTGFTLGP